MSAQTTVVMFLGTLLGQHKWERAVMPELRGPSITEFQTPRGYWLQLTLHPDGRLTGRHYRCERYQ